MTHRSTTPGAKPRRACRATAALALLAALAGCGDPPAAPREQAQPPADAGIARWIEAVLNVPWMAKAGPPVLVGAGDIARCYKGNDPRTATPPALTAAESTARLLDRIPGTVIAVGDNAYEAGSLPDYLLCYEPTWGRHKARTRPAIGNHEYISLGTGYLAYFGPVATAPPGYYYSYDLGAWHVVVLNSMEEWTLCPTDPAEITRPRSADEGRRCIGDPAQRAWLETDLATHRSRCTAVYFHHPRFSSGKHGSQYQMTVFWDILYRHGVDVVISGHDHLYERFAPQDPDGNVDAARGIRQFTVGTGGAELYGLGPDGRIANSEVLVNDTHGVLALALGGSGYGWAFTATSGATTRDAGSGSCH